MDETMLDIQPTANKPTIIYFIVVILSLLLISTFFMPYMSTVGDSREALLDFGDNEIYDELNMTSDEFADISLIEFAKISLSILGDDEEFVTIFTIIIAMVGGFTLLASLFALLKKCKASIAFTFLAIGSFTITFGTLLKDAMIDDDMLEKGIATTAFYLIAVALIVANIVFIIQKKAYKKAISIQN